MAKSPAFEDMTRDPLVEAAPARGVARPEVMTRWELVHELQRERDASRAKPRPKGWLGAARDLIAGLVEQGLNLPDTAKLIRNASLSSQDPAPALATVTLAEIYLAQGHAERALTTAEEVLAAEPEHAMALAVKRRARERLEETGGLSTAESEQRDTEPPASADDARAELEQATDDEEQELEQAIDEDDAIEAERLAAEADEPEPEDEDTDAGEPDDDAAHDADADDADADGGLREHEWSELGSSRDAEAQRSADAAPSDVAPSVDAAHELARPVQRTPEALGQTAATLLAVIEEHARNDDVTTVDTLVFVRRRDGDVFVYWELLPETALRLGPAAVLRVVEWEPHPDGARRRSEHVPLEGKRGWRSVDLGSGGGVVRVAAGVDEPSGFRALLVGSELASEPDAEGTLVAWSPRSGGTGVTPEQLRALEALEISS